MNFKIKTMKKIVNYNLIIIYLKNISMVLRIWNFIILSIILAMIKKITIFFNNHFR